MRVGSAIASVGVLVAVMAAQARSGVAGTVVGRLELPPAPERSPVLAKGFVDRIENPLAEIRKPSLAPYLIVALEPQNGARGESAPAQVTWDVVGESFARPVVAVPVGAEVVIKNQTKVARTIAALEDPKLFTGPLNPTGTKSFRASQAAVYTVTDKDAPYLRGKIVVVAAGHVASVDDNGRFEMADVPDGAYKLRVFYYDRAGEARGQPSDWLNFSSDVVVAARGRSNRAEVTAKLPPIDTIRAAPGRK